MSAQEFRPGRLSDSFGGRVDAVPFQDVCDRIVRQKMPQIGQRALEAADWDEELSRWARRRKTVWHTGH